MRITDPAGRVVPTIPKAAQAGNPHASALDVGLSSRVITLWNESIRQDACHPFANPDTAPSVVIVASFTDYTFAFRDGTWNDTWILPWVTDASDDIDQVSVDLVLGMDGPLSGLVVWAESQTLVAPVTTTVGALEAVPVNPAEMPPLGPWRTPLHQYELHRVSMEIHDPDNGVGKGEMALVFKAQWRPTIEPVSNAEQVNATVKIFSAQCWNSRRNLRDT